MELFEDIGMQEDLNEERRTAERRWSKWEKQIQRVITNTAGMYGDLQGLMGASLHNIPALADGNCDRAPIMEDNRARAK
jgi:hypothetical protein